jgi:gluconolactonase
MTMNRELAAVALVLALGAGAADRTAAARAQQPQSGAQPGRQGAPGPQAPRVARVVRLEPAFDAIVGVDTPIEKVGGGIGFAEGPVWMRDGTLVFSDVPGNTIFKLAVPAGTLTVIRKPSGYDGNDARPGQHVGSNGLTLDREGRLIIAEHGNRRVSRVDANGALTVLADRFEGKRLNSPNDVVVKSDGAIFFTDPPYGLPRQDDDPAKELTANGIYRIKDGKLQLLAEQTRPNGLGFSPDERYLYVANSDTAKRQWMRYDVRADGTLGAGQVFFDVTAESLNGIPDGMKVDAAGNLFGTGPAGVWVISPQGKVLGRIEAPETPANVAFGEDGTALFMTARTSVYRIKLKTPGPRPCCQ